MQRYNLFPKNQNFYFNFSLFLKKVAFCRKEYRRNTVYLYWLTSKINRYACTKSSRRLSLGPIRESLPNQSTSRSARPRNLRIRLQGKARAKQKEIGNYRFCRFFPIFAVSFYHVSPNTVFWPPRPVRRVRFFYRLLCGFRARIWAANSGRFLHI